MNKPETRPVIGLTPDIGETQARPGRPPLPRYELKQAYCEAVRAAGGLPIVLPYSDDIDAIASLLSLCEGVVITGGGFDIPPDYYGEAHHPRLGPLHPERSRFERLLVRAALARELPLLGICGGMQALAVELGATLIQDLESQLAGALEHQQKNSPGESGHTVQIDAGSLLARAARTTLLEVNSTHHQAVREPGRARVIARAPDGVIEAIEGPGRFALGVQWHPELMPGAQQLSIYRALVQAAART